MIICGSVNSNRSELLLRECANLLESGIAPDSILFLTLNAYKKNKVLSALKGLTGKAPLVQTYLGLCYNTILNNQQELEKHIPHKNLTENFSLCGLEVSQNLLLDAVREVGFQDYLSKINLVHQLLRRHSLIVSNNLTDEEVTNRSEILGEVFAPEAKKALDLFKTKTLELRAFDYIRQQSLFKYLYEKTDTLKNIKYIFIDDYDEQTPACTDFFKHLTPQLLDRFIGLDTKGSSRYGYLCADINCTEILNTDKKIVQAEEQKSNPQIKTKNFSKRLEMLKTAVSKIKTLIKDNIDVEEISIITPSFDNQLKFILESELGTAKLPTQFISGSEKLVETSIVRSTLSLLRLINNLEAGIDEINEVFTTLLKIPTKYTYPILQKFQNLGGFIKYDFSNKAYNTNYEKFLQLTSKTSEKHSLSTQLDVIYKEFISKNHTNNELERFEFLSKQIRDLEKTMKTPDKNRIITQLENSIIAENDADSFSLKRNAIVIGTPQKIIDYDIKTKYQFWLDTSSDDWIKQDTGTIYNAWVFQRNWRKSEFTYNDAINCVQEKTRRVLRKLYLLASKEIFAYSSSYNALGQENNLGITDFVKPTTTKEQKTTFTFTPREDQKEILDYSGGKMAITAVPGAGKTTVLQALIAKLIAKNIPPENIFVLTYMESAAKNIKERISTAYPDLDVMPNITTIHGLALRILKENGNYAKLNLSENFDICDDLLRQKLIRDCIAELHLNYDEYEKYEKGISVAKFVTPDKTPKTKELRDFIRFYELYNNKLKEHNLIDYDDMLIFAVKILDENPEIQAHYSNLAHYIIEDEAQDSSAIQQKLITLLAEKHGNIVRCGDLNQAITTTFTNADIKGFKEFIKQSTSTEMNHSQRCARGVFELANELIEEAKKLPDNPDAFYNIKMQEVEGKNPTSETPVTASLFISEDEEKTAIITQIKDILRIAPTSTIAILLRNNFQVNTYATLLKDHGISTLSRTDCLEQTSIFNIILSILRFCNEPWNNYFANEIYKNLFNIKEDNTFLTELETPFITQDTSYLKDENLIQLHWELNFWLAQAHKSYELLSLKIGEYYCKTDTEVANLFIISEIIRKISSNATDKKELTEKLAQIGKKPTLSGLKLFTDNDTDLSTITGGKVQIMTMHKAKGDEFDYVFVPELTENALPLTLSAIKNNEHLGFYEEIKALDSDYLPKNALQVKKEILEENLRLFYVTITRAKRSLKFSCANKYKKFGRLRNTTPSPIFDTLLAPYLNNK